MCCTSWHDEILRENEKKNTTTTTTLETCRAMASSGGKAESREGVKDSSRDVSTREPRWKWQQVLLGYGHSIPAPTSMLRNPGFFRQETAELSKYHEAVESVQQSYFKCSCWVVFRLKNLYFSVYYRLLIQRARLLPLLPFEAFWRSENIHIKTGWT